MTVEMQAFAERWESPVIVADIWRHLVHLEHPDLGTGQSDGQRGVKAFVESSIDRLNSAAYTQAVRRFALDREPTEEEVRAAAAILSRRGARAGGLKGGRARARKLSPERRRAIARKAAQARWAETKVGARS